MKPHFPGNLRLKKKIFSKARLLPWLIFHLTFIVLLLLYNQINVNTSLHSILPDTNPVKVLSEVENRLSNHLNSSMTILIGHEDFQEARKAGALLEDKLLGVEDLNSIQYELDQNALNRFYKHLHKYRYKFISSEVESYLNEKDVLKLSERAFFTITSPVSMGFLDYLDKDPFLLANENLQYFLSNGVMSNMAVGVRDSVLARDFEGKSWVLLTLGVNDNGIAVNIENSPVKAIYDISEEIKSTNKGIDIILSGVPFHSYSSTLDSKKEISLLSTISTLFIIFLILLVFRSFKPLIMTIVTISLGMFTGFVLTLLLFKEIHIFTIVFGTSLIGISVDYSFHFFSEWSLKKLYNGNKGVIKHILPGISVGIITTLISYGAFTFSPFPLLQQISLFSISGLISTYITVVFLFPFITQAKKRTVNSTRSVSEFIFKLFRFPSKIPLNISIVILILTVVFTGYGLFRTNLDNNIRSLYKMDPQLFEWEQKAAEILDHGSTGIYMLIEGDSLENNLLLEESMILDLENIKRDGSLESFLSLSSFLPSKTQQYENYTKVETFLAPYVKEQLILLGFDETAYIRWLVDFKKSKESNMSIEDLSNLPLGTLVDKLNIGFVGENYYTAVLLFGINNYTEIESIAEKSEKIYLVNKVDDTSNTLQDLSILALTIISISYIVIFLCLIPRYGLNRAARIVFIPIGASLISLSIVTLAGLPVNIFVVVGLILIPGMGTDYIIILSEARTSALTALLSITLSMLTTVLAFGLLGFTSIAGVFGLTVSIGILATYILTSFFSQSRLFNK